MEIKDYFSIAIPSLALCIAMYTFLSNNPKFREFSAKFWIVVILQLLSIIFCTLILTLNILFISYESNYIYIAIKKVFNLFFVFFFGLSWLYLLRLYYIIYGSLYHLRKKRFLKYTKFFSWFYEKFFHKKFYETNFRKRDSIDLSYLGLIDNEQLNKIINGGSILLLYNDNFKNENILVSFILNTVNSNETIDYITTFKSPIEICYSIPEKELLNVTKKISIIDCFSPFYGYDDKVIKFEKENFTRKGYKFFSADSFAEIHSATNSSWYRFRKLLEREENQYRLPHRTIYDTLSSLIRFSSEEQYFLFLRHIISSEKSYGMITLILEPTTINEKIKSELIRMTDIVLHID